MVGSTVRVDLKWTDYQKEIKRLQPSCKTDQSWRIYVCTYRFSIFVGRWKHWGTRGDVGLLLHQKYFTLILNLSENLEWCCRVNDDQKMLNISTNQVKHVNWYIYIHLLIWFFFELRSDRLMQFAGKSKDKVWIIF